MYATATMQVSINGKLFPNFYPIKITGEDFALLQRQEFFQNIILEQVPRVFQKRLTVDRLKDVADKIVLIKRYGGIGDVIWTLPVARELKNRFGAKIIYAVLPKDKELIALAGYETTKNKITFDDLANCDYFLDFFESVENYKPAAYLDPYDISWEWAFGSDYDDDKNFLDCFTIRNDTKYVKNPEKTIVFGVASSSPKRTYAFWEVVAEKILKNSDYEIIIVSDRKNFNLKHPRILDLTGQLKTTEVFEIIKAAKFILGCDSGLLHIAGQLRKRGIFLFSTVNPDTRIKYYSGIIPIVAENVDCKYCLQLSEKCPIECEAMRGISPDLIVDKFFEVLK